MKPKKKILLLATCALGLSFVTTPATTHAAADKTYQWQTFNDWDADRSGYIDNGEYQSYAFGMADWDNDGYLEDTEWASYTQNFYDSWDLDYDSVTYYDTNGDGYIDETEFSDFADTDDDLYDTWDYDNDDLISSNDWDQVTAHYYDAE